MLARAQPLHLDGPTSPPPGACRSLLAWADRLEAPGAPRDAEPLRTLAAAALRAAEKASPASPRAVLAAMTFAEREPALEGMLASLDPSARDLLARDAGALARAVPTDPDELATALRDVCAPLVPPGTSANPWLAWGEDPAPGLGALAEARAADKELDAALRGLEARLDLADASPAYAAAAAAWRRRVAAAAGLATAPPAWVPAQARRAAAAQLAEAIARAAEDPRSPEASQRLRRLELLGRVAAGLDAVRGPAAQTGQQALARSIAAGVPADPAARAGETRRLEAVARAADLLPARERSRDEKRLVRQFRPALRTMLELARLSEQDLLEVLAEAIGSDAADAAEAPKFIAALAAHRGRLEDLAALDDASAAILRSQPEGPPGADRSARDEYRFLGDRLLAYAKEAYDLAQRNDPLLREDLERALARVRFLAVDCRDFAVLPGEEDLRAARGEGMLAANAPGLLKALDADRAVWRKRWANADKPPLEEGQRLRRLHHLMAALADAARAQGMLTDGTLLAAANAWPGWELSQPTLRALADGLPEAVAAACKAQDDQATGRLLDRYAPALLAGRMSRLLARDQPLLLVSEVTAGAPPAGTPMADRLEDLARVCRESAEFAARDAAGADALRPALARTAKACLQDLPLSPPPHPAPPPSR